MEKYIVFQVDCSLWRKWLNYLDEQHDQLLQLGDIYFHVSVKHWKRKKHNIIFYDQFNQTCDRIKKNCGYVSHEMFSNASFKLHQG